LGGSLVSGPDASVFLPELDISIPLAEIYADIDLVFGAGC